MYNKRFQFKIDKKQIFLIPTIGFLYRYNTYNYVRLCFAWLCFLFSIELGKAGSRANKGR